MNLGRGFSIPWDKGVIQNGDICVPATPEKPVLQRPNNSHSEMPNNQIWSENWRDLMGIYTGVLQNDSGNLLPQKFNPNGQGAGSYNQMQHCSSSSGTVELLQNFSPNGLIGVKSLEHNMQHGEISRLQRFRTMDQKTGTTVSKLGELIPQKVNTLAELMNMVSPTKAPLLNVTSNRSTHVTSSTTEPLLYATPNRSTYVMNNAAVVCPHSLAESSPRNRTLGGAKLQQNDVFLTDCDVGGYNLQETPSGRHSVPQWQSYNLNLPPTFESGEPSSVARPFSLGPVTPTQQKQSKNYEIIHVPFPVTNGSSSKEMHDKDNAALSQQTEILEREQNESLCITQDKPTEASLTSPAENNSGGGNERIDLNKTPQQKTPKRRKHRPKVVVERKPKKTPKPAATRSSTPDGKPKRKYVRKNGNKTTTPSTEVGKIVEESDAEPTQKSCKRALNFDLDNREEKESNDREFDFQGPNNKSSKLSLNLNSDCNNAEWPHLSRSPTSVVKEGYQNSCSKETQQINAADSFVYSNKVVAQNSMPQVTMGSTSLTPPTPPTPPTPKGHTLNVIARRLSAQKASMNQIGVTNSHNHVHQRISGSIAHLVIQANSCEPNFQSRRQLMLQTVPQLQNLVDANGEMGSKREHSHAQLRQIEMETFLGSQLHSYGASKTGQCNNDSDRLRQNALEKGKMKTGEKLNGTSASIPSGITAIEDSWGRKESVRNNNFPARSTSMHQHTSLTSWNRNVQSMARNSKDKPNISNSFITYYELMREFQQKHASTVVPPCAGQTVQKTPNLANKPNTNSLCLSVNWNPDSAFQRDGKSVPTNGIVTSPDPVTIKKRTVGRPRKGDDIFLLPKSKSSQSHEHSSMKIRGLQQKMPKTALSVDGITDGMKELHINDNGNALVLYKGRDGAVVPYEDFDLVKKKQPRPRVDLDPETNRLWNLLMGKEGSENAEPMDANKQKWWEEERKIFRGRVDSFIARMHLVQGDRRFSKWKGSVVDSVIGVFLTQNVSDHLSSSAFMSLAAKFPVKSATFGSCYEKGSSSSVVHQKVHITFPDGTTCDQKVMNELSYNNVSTTYPQSSQNRAANFVKEKGTSTINGHARKAEEEIISSQSSSESVIFQASEDIRSSSGSNSEAENGWNFSKNLGYLNVPEHPERISALQQHQFHTAGYRPNLGQANGSNGYSHPITSKIPTHRSSVPQSSNNYWTNMLMGPDEVECLSGWASTNFEVSNGKGIEVGDGNIGVGAGIRFTATQNGRNQFQQPPANHAILNRNHELQTDFLNGSRSRNGQNFSIHGQRNQVTSQKDTAFQTDPSSSAQASNEQTNDYSKNAGVTLVTTEKEQVNSSRKPSHTVNSTTSNARKRKAENGKDESFDWDILRRQVHSKNGTRERSWETMDSMDYEALKNADVREVSDTIKERGMNNMLAERIKAFLNRLVRDHGRIDLEWLRDVPPDKAKDYLLSVRGLGLKSVECVRLLTLHHLAFPVDTNVGRIAVRLGWVPLQPLPESLQLHLLELYPVLESIQKYLWPRLCMLDQETLYELHYQMITFGKVFCTKREPNCNACPMRAECRHFASAFASARLALPAPGEKQMVSSAAPNPISGTKSPGVVIKPLLPSVDTSIERGIGLTSNSEPLVEEPSSPEPPTEVLEKDIEDAFYEDPDEIPVIKLNVEEFTTNLQNIIQEKMELGEGDMSKALVALSPELASIPVPKLKHVSRLRTEHQVYELPDSHPLLIGMDRREPDDPSPYLLAIWTPGETPDSVQPPERTCTCQEGGGLCGKSTCFSCSSARESQGLTVRGTILIPCRTAMRGSFPLNGTYFQVNEVFADHDSSLNPIDVPRTFLWNLPRRTVFFGTSVSTIFKGLTTEGIQYCFWKGFVCVRGFDQKSRAPRPLKARLHLPASKMTKKNE